MKYVTKSEKDTQALGKKFAQKCRGGEVFLLTGELGGGKTQFTKGLAEGLSVTEVISSPTFTFEKVYKAKDNLSLCHFDLYRSDSLDPDIEELIKESVSQKSNVVAIEWAERAHKIWPERHFLISFEWLSDLERVITVKEVGR
jgi:tRNA threonylcarbamoyladenosine biosynthesis protein TsaE